MCIYSCLLDLTSTNQKGVTYTNTGIGLINHLNNSVELVLGDFNILVYMTRYSLSKKCHMHLGTGCRV